MSEGDNDAELQPLLQYDSGEDFFRPGEKVTCTVTSTMSCVPRLVRLPFNVLEHFRIHDIRAGVEPVLAVTAGDPLAAGQTELRQVVLERGMDFSVEVENTSDEPRAFAFKVWGTLPS